MKYLLDVNALIAWRHARAPQHLRFHTWVNQVGLKNVVSCAHVELGFIRVSMQVFGYTHSDAQIALSDMKSQMGRFIEHAPSPKLDAWATEAAKTSDAFLIQIARENGLRLATFDQKIPGSFLIS